MSNSFTHGLSVEDALALRDEFDRIYRQLLETGASHYRMPEGTLQICGFALSLSGCGGSAKPPPVCGGTGGNKTGLRWSDELGAYFGPGGGADSYPHAGIGNKIIG